jgi:hypothetical protein
MDKARQTIMNAEFVRKFYGNAQQTNSYPPALVEDLCLSHEALRKLLEEATVMLTFITVGDVVHEFLGRAEKAIK